MPGSSSIAHPPIKSDTDLGDECVGWTEARHQAPSLALIRRRVAVKMPIGGWGDGLQLHRVHYCEQYVTTALEPCLSWPDERCNIIVPMRIAS